MNYKEIAADLAASVPESEITHRVKRENHSVKLYDGVHSNRLQILYELAARQKSDMRVHVPTLARLAAGKQVLELGVRYGVSTIALLFGGPTRMVSVDLAPFVYEESFYAITKEQELDWMFLRMDSCDPALKKHGDFDLVFIDTTHTYECVAKELRMHCKYGSKARTIVFHDTVYFGETGDSMEPGKGIMPAIRDFLAERPEWNIAENYTYNYGPEMTPEEHYERGCGLMVLTR